MLTLTSLTNANSTRLIATLSLISSFNLTILSDQSNQSSMMFELLKYCLTYNPCSYHAAKIRTSSIPLLLTLNLTPLSTTLSLLRPLRLDQDHRVRLTYIQTLRLYKPQDSDEIVSEYYFKLYIG
jgi:hypothetical protein